MDSLYPTWIQVPLDFLSLDFAVVIQFWFASREQIRRWRPRTPWWIEQLNRMSQRTTRFCQSIPANNLDCPHSRSAHTESHHQHSVWTATLQTVPVYPIARDTKSRQNRNPQHMLYSHWTDLIKQHNCADECYQGANKQLKFLFERF